MTLTLGNRIRSARLHYGMSQAELARRVGISTQGMNLIESGKVADPAASKVRAIALTLHVTSDFLLGIEAPRSPASEGRVDTLNGVR